jgi:hypothetical protein
MKKCRKGRNEGGKERKMKRRKEGWKEKNIIYAHSLTGSGRCDDRAKARLGY